MDMKKAVRLSDAAQIAGIEVGQLRNWIQREKIILVESDWTPAEARGSYSLITARGVLRIAITAKLTHFGMPVSAACRAAMQFVDSGTERRMPGKLFATGKTALIIRGSEFEAELINFKSDQEFANDVFFNLDSAQEAAVLLPLNALVEHVEKKLMVSGS